MRLELVLFTVFALLSAFGLYLVGKHFASRRAGFWLAFGTVAFFVALGLALRWIATAWGG